MLYLQSWILYFSEVDWDTDLKGALRIFLENEKNYIQFENE